MKHKLTFYEVVWTDGCVDLIRPDKYRTIINYKDLHSHIYVVRKVKRSIKWKAIT